MIQKPTMTSANFRRILGLSASGILQAGAAVAMVCTLVAFLGRFHWIVDLTVHFRTQYALGCLGLSLFLFAFRHPKWATATAVAAFVNFIVISPLFVHPHKEDEPYSGYSLLLSNVNTRLGKPERVLEATKKEHPDLIVLLEVDAKWLQILSPLEEDYPYSKQVPMPNNFGLAVYSRFPLDNIEVFSLIDQRVPSIQVSVQLPESDPLTLIATHPVPPMTAQSQQHRNRHLLALADRIPSEGPVLLAGDLNTTPWSPVFRDLVQRSGLQDSTKGYGIQATWPKPNLLFGIPIDHVLYSEELVVLDRRIGPDVGSDHATLMVHIGYKRKWK